MIIGQIICAWCGRVLGEKPDTEDTHTICAECEAEISEEIEALECES